MVSQIVQQYRVTVFGEPRGDWHPTYDEAKLDAIHQRLASWDDSRREWFLAVPVDVESRHHRVEVEEKPMAGRRGEAWNDEDVAVLREQARAGNDLLGIARRLERTPAAVQSKARKLRIKVQP